MGNAQAIKQHIQTSEKTGVFTINNQKLKEVPQPIQTLAPTLRTIDLSDNLIVSLPSWIGTFVALKSLAVNNNQLHTLPGQIGNLTKMETLSLTGNTLVKLPDEVANLSALKYLHLQNNAFTEFPSVICKLPNLEVVDLSKNRITRIPDEIASLRAHELNLNNNQVSLISGELHKCPRLKVLRLQENCIPAGGISPKILRDSQISLLVLEGNIFQMKELQYIEGYEQYMERYTASKKKI